jgi:hypothetical protein
MASFRICKDEIKNIIKTEQCHTDECECKIDNEVYEHCNCNDKDCDCRWNDD